MKKRTIAEKKELLEKLIKFCNKNNLWVEEAPSPSSKYPLEVKVIIENYIRWR